MIDNNLKYPLTSGLQGIIEIVSIRFRFVEKRHYFGLYTLKYMNIPVTDSLHCPTKEIPKCPPMYTRESLPTSYLHQSGLYNITGRSSDQSYSMRSIQLQPCISCVSLPTTPASTLGQRHLSSLARGPFSRSSTPTAAWYYNNVSSELRASTA